MLNLSRPILPLALLISIFSFSSVYANEKEDTQALQFGLAKHVVKRRPIAISDTFVTDGGKVYAYLKIQSPKKTQITVEWIRNGSHYHTMNLNVKKSKSFRTWAYIQAQKHLAGQWNVIVRNEDGSVIGEKGFELEKE